ncbi:hypothetical protein, conserved [Angomonas deanei]|uniref:Uncharacterized protein n=1 Tax=Angomonas deanei TaxID=59799 RepID=A0A7G2C3U2_9TRYP|nr:hypothetical protein, conserved [Angomonas deanei]
MQYVDTQINVVTQRYLDLSLIPAIMEGRRVASNYENTGEESYLCSLLGGVDDVYDVEFIQLRSFTNATSVSCQHHNPLDPSAIAAARSRNSRFDNMYYVNKTTHRMEEPLRLFKVATNYGQSISEVQSYVFDNGTFFSSFFGIREP